MIPARCSAGHASNPGWPATTPRTLAGGLPDLMTTHLRAEVLVMAVAGIGSEQLLAVRASALTELRLHAKLSSGRPFPGFTRRACSKRGLRILVVVLDAALNRFELNHIKRRLLIGDFPESAA